MFIIASALVAAFVHVAQVSASALPQEETAVIQEQTPVSFESTPVSTEEPATPTEETPIPTDEPAAPTQQPTPAPTDPATQPPESPPPTQEATPAATQTPPSPQEAPPEMVEDWDSILASDLQIVARVSAEAVRPGQWITYTLRYTNTYRTSVSNVLIQATVWKDQLFDGTYRSDPVIPLEQYTYTGSSSDNYTLEWRLPTLASQSHGVITYRVQVSPALQPDRDKSKLLLGTASKISTTQAGVTGAEEDAVPMVVGPLLSLSKDDGVTRILPGHWMTYTLTLLNYSREDAIPATNFVITDVVPANTTFVSATAGGVYNAERNEVSWRFPGPLRVGATQVVRFRILVTDQIDSGEDIVNSRDSFHAIASEMNTPVRGRATIRTDVDKVLNKTARNSQGDTSSPHVYPTQEIVYSITVYNPLNEPLSGVVITDTLPGNPEPFIYKRPASGSPAPAIRNNGRSLVWTVDIPAWGSVKRDFVVEIPRQTYIPANATSESYYNALSAYHPRTYFSTETTLAKVVVDAPVTMSKTVSPNHVINGDPVTYTISLTNEGPYVVSNIRLTDTLPIASHYQFTYLEMVSGPDPLLQHRENPVVWTGITVRPGQTYSLSFIATAMGDWLDWHYNDLNAYSDDVYIPARTNRAGVYIDSPIKINKTVEPTTAFQGQTVSYQIQLFNYSQDTWRLSQVQDDLPDGFYQVGGNYSNLADIPIDPRPYNIAPDGSWTGSFTALIAQVDCSSLPKTIYNAAGAVRQTFVSPEATTMSNLSRLAPLVIEPNVQVDLIPYHYAVKPGGIIVYNLHMVNISPIAANDTTVTLNLPAGLSFVEMVSGSPEPSEVEGQTIVWTNLQIPAHNEISVRFRVQVDEDATYNIKTPTATMSDSTVCIGKLGTGDHELGSGKVKVVENVVYLVKDAKANYVPPLGLVSYDVDIVNEDKYNYAVSAIVDILHDGFTFDTMVEGPAPSRITTREVRWNDLVLPPGRTEWRIQLKASSVYLISRNEIRALASDGSIIHSTLSDPVTVAPTIDLKQDVYPLLTRNARVVPYTITLVNQSRIDFTNIIITDTLPAGFTYIRNRIGPLPVALGPRSTRPVWQIPSCRKESCVIKIAFDVMIGPMVPLGRHTSQVIGTSPSGSIPGPVFTPITVTQRSPIIFIPLIKRR